MRKSFTLSASAIALLLVGATGMSAVSAATINATQWDSEAKIAFEANTTTPPDVTNPEVPDVEGPEGVAGALAIDYASDLDFGTHEISANEETYYAKADTAAFGSENPVGAFVEMHDLRGEGEGNGTNLTVKQVSQFKNGTKELSSAVLSFSDARAQNAKGGAYVPSGVGNFDLVPGDATTVMTTDGTVGEFLTSFGTAADYEGEETGGPISLSVPSGSATAGNYTTTLQWDLVTDPS